MFLQSCFIRNNTKEIISKLEELGYKKNSPSWTDKCNIIWCYQYSNEKGFDTPQYVIADSFDIPFDNNSRLCGKFIDCGTNEELFLALAALRNDTDRYQWFTDIPGHWYKNNYFDEGYKFIFHHPILSDFNSHKATVKEIIEHFKEK